MATTAHVDADIQTLIGHIQRLGKLDSDGAYTVTFGQLFKDDSVQNTLESLAGTLKAAKKRSVVSYKPELLLQGLSDNEIITLKSTT